MFRTKFTRKRWTWFLFALIVFIVLVWTLPKLWAPKLEPLEGKVLALRPDSTGTLKTDSSFAFNFPNKSPIAHRFYTKSESSRRAQGQTDPDREAPKFPYQTVLTILSLLLAVLKGITDLIASLKKKSGG